MSVRILGLGNVLMGDDGFGPYVVRVLEAEWEADPLVEVLDAGTPGLDLVPHISGAQALIFVDTVAMRGPPGRVRVYRADALLGREAAPRVQAHDPGLREALLALELEGAAPRDVALVGACPARVAPGTGLSAAVRACVPVAALAVVRELRRLGVRPRRRTEPAAPDIWWEEAACTS